MPIDLADAIGESQASPGWSKLGAVLGGNGGDTTAYDRGFQRAAKMESLVAQAKKDRDEALARQQVRSAARTAGVPENQLDLVEALSVGKMGTDFNAGMSGLGKLQDQNLQTQMTTAATGGDIDLANALTIPASNKPLVRSKVEGQNIIDPYADPTEQVPITTEQGTSVVNRNNAAAVKSLRVPAPKAAKLAANPAERAIFNAHVRDINDEYQAQLDDPTVNAETARAERDKKLEALGVPSRVGGAGSKEDFIAALEVPLGKPLTDDQRARVVQGPDGEWSIDGTALNAEEVATSSARSKAEGAQSPTPINRSGKPIPVTDATVGPPPIEELEPDATRLPDALPIYNTTNPPAASDKPKQPKKSGKGSINRDAFKSAWNAIKGGKDRNAVVQRLREHGYNREADQLLKQLP